MYVLAIAASSNWMRWKMIRRVLVYVIAMLIGVAISSYVIGELLAYLVRSLPTF